MKTTLANVIEVDAIWPHVAEKFNQAAQDHGDDLSSGELWQMCRGAGAFLIYAADEQGFGVACVARFERWNNGMVLRVLSLVGERMAEWMEDGTEFLKNMARIGGASRVVWDGRDGWTRAGIPNVKRMRSTFVMEL